MEVSKLDKFIDIKEEQLVNIKDIYSTDDVSKFDILIDVNEEQ